MKLIRIKDKDIDIILDIEDVSIAGKMDEHVVIMNKAGERSSIPMDFKVFADILRMKGIKIG